MFLLTVWTCCLSLSLSFPPFFHIDQKQWNVIFVSSMYLSSRSIVCPAAAKVGTDHPRQTQAGAPPPSPDTSHSSHTVWKRAVRAIIQARLPGQPEEATQPHRPGQKHNTELPYHPTQPQAIQARHSPTNHPNQKQAIQAIQK